MRIASTGSAAADLRTLCVGARVWTLGKSEEAADFGAVPARDRSLLGQQIWRRGFLRGRSVSAGRHDQRDLLNDRYGQKPQ